MGNTSSDSLGHSFKRLRLSEIEQLSHTSPSSISPKRKVVSSVNGNANDIFNDLINSCNQETPVILCDDADHSSATADPTSQSFEIDAKKDCDVILRFKDDHSFVTQPCTTTVPEKDSQKNFASVELSDEEIILCNDADHSSATAAPTSQSFEIDAKKDCDVILRFKDDHSFVTQPCTTTVPEKDSQKNFASVELSDEEIIMCLRSRKIVSDLSDADILVCLKHAYANKDC